MADIFTLPFRKYNPNHDERGRFSSGGVSAMAARGGKGKSRRNTVLERLRRESRTAARRRPASSKDQREKMASDYARWLAQRDGIGLPKLRSEGGVWAWENKDQLPKVEWAKVDVGGGKQETRVKSVYFPGFTENKFVPAPLPDNYYSLSPRGQRAVRNRLGPGEWVKLETPGVRINIPNWDHVPKVTRHVGKLFDPTRLWVGPIYKQRWDWA